MQAAHVAQDDAAVLFDPGQIGGAFLAHRCQNLAGVVEQGQRPRVIALPPQVDGPIDGDFGQHRALARLFEYLRGPNRGFFGLRIPAEIGQRPHFADLRSGYIHPLAQLLIDGGGFFVIRQGTLIFSQAQGVGVGPGQQTQRAMRRSARILGHGYQRLGDV